MEVFRWEVPLEVTPLEEGFWSYKNLISAHTTRRVTYLCAESCREMSWGIVMMKMNLQLC